MLFKDPGGDTVEPQDPAIARRKDPDTGAEELRGQALPDNQIGERECSCPGPLERPAGQQHGEGGGRGAHDGSGRHQDQDGDQSTPAPDGITPAREHHPADGAGGKEDGHDIRNAHRIDLEISTDHRQEWTDHGRIELIAQDGKNERDEQQAVAGRRRHTWFHINPPRMVHASRQAGENSSFPWTLALSRGAVVLRSVGSWAGLASRVTVLREWRAFGEHSRD